MRLPGLAIAVVPCTSGPTFGLSSVRASYRTNEGVAPLGQRSGMSPGAAGGMVKVRSS